MDIYTETILEYYRHPRNHGSIEGADIVARDSNPVCGDVVELYIKINSNTIKDIKFSGHGCAISQASASMLTEMVAGKNLDYVKNLKKEDILEVLGIELSAVRLKCALLGLKVLKLGVYDYLGQKMEEEIL
jgi:nitrogen fixation NifU-like protein